MSRAAQEHAREHQVRILIGIVTSEGEGDGDLDQPEGTREKPRVIVPGATRLFEEPGTLDKGARLAAIWLTRHASGPLPEWAGSAAGQDWREGDWS